MQPHPTGTLHVAATPIGNLGDLSPNLLSLLKSASHIACEDTRVSEKLLSLSESKARLISHHKFNEEKTLQSLLEILLSGKDLILISDAGTPCISDPGFKLVAKAHEHHIPVKAVPGPSAPVSALSISGFSGTPFLFLGFLPRKNEEITELLERYSGFQGSVCFFESPHRLRESLGLLADLMEESTQICLCKEISKKFEKTFRGPLPLIAKEFSEMEILGEWTCVLESLSFKTSSHPKAASFPDLGEVASFFNIPRSQASKILSLVTGKSRRELYKGQ